MNRSSNLKLLNNKTFDFIIIGGGATGLGCALDASSRGCSVLLVEKHDFCKGTSSRSTKLIHGGVRYLEKGQFSLVYQALKERDILYQNASHLVNEVGFLIPTYNIFYKIYYWLGLKLYDLISGNKIFNKSKMIGKKEAISLVPNIERDKLNGGIVYYDGQFNDSRMGLDIALTASDNNAVLINYMSFESFIKNKKNNIIGVNTTDILTGNVYKVFGQKIINCTGVFSDSILRKDSFNSKPLIKPSQGIHLVVEKKFLKGDFGILVPKTSDGRILFAVPWLGHVLLGTTETDIDKPVIDPSPKKIEIDFILNTINKYMEIKPKKSDVKSVFVGLRPLISSNKKGKSKDLSRTHKIIISSSGLVSVVGGKWTNYRIMGKEVIDLSLKKMNQKFIKSNTETLKIKNGLSKLDLKEKSLSKNFYLSKSQIIHFVRNEMAINIDDIMSRRSRCLFLSSEESEMIAPIVVKIMSEELSQNQDWIDEQLIRFNKLIKLYKI